MTETERVALSTSRLDKASRMLDSAKLLLEHNDFASACNRAYYSVFHAMRAVLALDEIDDHKHSHLISVFRKNYLKTGILERSLSDIIGSAFEVRNSSDYEDFWVIAKTDASEQVENAEVFFKAIEAYVATRGVQRTDA